MSKIRVILGCGPAPKLLAEDCFDMGTVAYQSGRYGQARDWLNMADELISQGRHDEAVNRTEVLEYLAWIEYVVRKLTLVPFILLNF